MADFFSSRAVERKDSLEWAPWLVVGRDIKNPFRAAMPKIQEKLQRDKARQDWNSWIVLSVVFWAEQEGMERLVTELGCIFVLSENEQQVKSVMGWDGHEGQSLSMNECKQLLNVMGEKNPSSSLHFRNCFLSLVVTLSLPLSWQ